MSWTPPDQIALDLDDCEQLGLLLWHESAPADFDAAEYLLANPQRRAAPDMAEALRGLVERYCALVDSGDAGVWDPEGEDEVAAARAALAKAEGKEG